MKLKRAQTALASIASLMAAACYPGDPNCDTFFTSECIIEEVEVPGSRCETGYYVNGECSHGEPTYNPGPEPEHPSDEGGGGGPLGGGASADEGRAPVTERVNEAGDTELSFSEYKFTITITQATKTALKNQKVDAIINALKKYQMSPRLREALDYINRLQERKVIITISDRAQRGPGLPTEAFEDTVAAKIRTGSDALYITLNANYRGEQRPGGGTRTLFNSASLVTETVVHELIHPVVQGTNLPGTDRRPTEDEEEAIVKERTKEAMKNLLTFDELNELEPIEVQEARARCAPIEQQCTIFLAQEHPACNVCSAEGLGYVQICVAQSDPSCVQAIPATEQIDTCLSLDPRQFSCFMSPPSPYDELPQIDGSDRR